MALDLVIGATAYASTVNTAHYVAANAINNNLSDAWISVTGLPPHWLAVDLGSAKIVTCAMILSSVPIANGVKDFKVQGSNDTTNGSDGTWADLYTGLQANDTKMQKYTWGNTIGYRWYRIYCTSAYYGGGRVGISELWLYEKASHLFMPWMTADNAPSPYVVSTSFTPSTGYDAYKAFDDAYNVAASFVSTEAGTTTGIITVDLGEDNEHIVTGYNLLQQFAANFHPRMPKNWTFDGSNDNSNWTTLDTQSNITTWVYNSMKEFAFSNSDAYRYYRLNITANNGHATLLCIGAIQLLGYSGSEPAPPVSSGIILATFI